MKLRQTLLILGTFTLATAAACIIPDRDILILRDDCGEEWGTQTIGAYGYNAVGGTEDIKSEDDEWLEVGFGLTLDEAEDAATPGTDINEMLLEFGVALCQAHAFDLGITDDDNTCVTTASVVHWGTCPLSSDQCDEGDGETGGGGEGDGLLSELTLSDEVSLFRGTRTISLDLIEAFSYDSDGVLADGTRATQLLDPTGTPYAFKISGVTSTNLGGVLGLVNDDEVTEVSATVAGTTTIHPVASYDDLMAIAVDLLAADSARLTLTRAATGSTKVLRFSRGT